MSPARAPAPAHRAPHPPSTADNATAPSTPEASRPGSAQSAPAPERDTRPPATLTEHGALAEHDPAQPSPPALTQRRPGPVDWPAHLARLDELRSETGALPRGALVNLAAELGVKEGTVYSQVSRRRRDEALREQGRLAALAQALTDPSCSDPESQAADLAQTSPQARRRSYDRPPDTRHAVLQRPDFEEAALAVTDPREAPAHLADPELIHRGSPSPTSAAAHRVELRCPGCAALLTLALADPSCSSPAPKGEAAPETTYSRRQGEPRDPELVHSGSPSPTHTPTVAPTEPGAAADANLSTPEPCPRKTSP